MTYLKGILVGMAAAVAASVAYILCVFVLPILLPFLLSRLAGGGGMAAGVVSSGPVLAIAAIAFAGGFYWQVRRVRRSHRSHQKLGAK